MKKSKVQVEFSVHGQSCFFHNVIAPIRDGEEVIGILGVNVDITDRRRAEEELQKANERLELRVLERTAELTKANERLQAEVQQRRQAEEQLVMFRRFAEAATQGFGMADVDGQIAYVNPFLARLFGAQKPEDVIGKHVSAYYPSDYLRRREREIIPALRRREHWQGEQMMVFPDGQMHSTIHSIFPVHDEHGALLCTAAVITDITELRRAEDALRQSYEELRTIHECMVDGLLIADIETKGFVKTNQAICEMLGYSAAELLSMSVQDIHPQEALPAVLAAFQSQVEGRLVRAAKLPLLRRDGSVLLADVSANQIAYNGRPCLIGFFRDVTESRRAEIALAESEAKYRRLVETTDTGFLILDEQGRVVDANAEYVRITGHNALQEILGRSVVEWTAPHDARRNAQEVECCLTQGNVRHLVVDYVRDDGAVTPVEVNASVVETGQGRRILSLCRDITERRRAEEKLKAEQRALRRMLLASDHERQLITYELHDGVAQQLMGAIMHFQSQEPGKGRKSKATDAYQEGMAALRQASLGNPQCDESAEDARVGHVRSDGGDWRSDFAIAVRTGCTGNRMPPAMSISSDWSQRWRTPCSASPRKP